MIASNVCQKILNEVIKKDLCTFCGACVGMCPYLIAYNGRIVLRDTCDLSQGRCSTFCPRISLNLDRLSKTLFGNPYDWFGMGRVEAVFMVRSNVAEFKERAQDAGAVTTLVSFAREEGFIDSALLTRFEDKSLPRGIIVSKREEIMACSGSSYMATPTLETFNRATPDVYGNKFGFVGTPCQVLALTKMKESKLEIRDNNAAKIELVIGVFCTWAFSFPDFAQFLREEIPAHILKYNVPPHPANLLQIYTEKERIDVPLDRVLPFVRPACHACHDLTAEFADISVGSGRGEVSEWNTVIVRTTTGMELIDAAKRKGVIEIRDIPDKNLSRLQEASYNKKGKALKYITEKTGSVNDLSYFEINTDKVQRFSEKQKRGPNV